MPCLAARPQQHTHWCCMRAAAAMPAQVLEALQEADHLVACFAGHTHKVLRGARWKNIVFIFVRRCCELYISVLLSHPLCLQ